MRVEGELLVFREFALFLTAEFMGDTFRFFTVIIICVKKSRVHLHPV
jgi:hypothetical protein